MSTTSLFLFPVKQDISNLENLPGTNPEEQEEKKEEEEEDCKGNIRLVQNIGEVTEANTLTTRAPGNVESVLANKIQYVLLLHAEWSSTNDSYYLRLLESTSVRILRQHLSVLSFEKQTKTIWRT
ncbi:hypothetical protein P5673_003640 [Acropora cervicornis]|uniref:Uncharacterized protein n=1 Tax=Acropora cervicornis TaxID=6130 RepID=A0AAD9VE01_ACRCE|nr:hypothetical protein P5673_003640 [Acropora cervicornis]